MYEPKVTIGPKVPVNDLNLDIVGDNTRWGAVVKWNDDFKDILRWLGEQVPGLPEDIRLIAQGFTGDILSEADGDPVTDTIIQFGEGANAYRHYSTMVGLMPHVTRVELLHRYNDGKGADNIVMYSKPKPPQGDGSPSPIGAKWPERGPNVFRPSVDNPTAKGYAIGDKYKDATGTYQLDKQWWGWLSFVAWLKVA